MTPRTLAAALAIAATQVLACGSVDSSAQSPVASGPGGGSAAGTVAPDFTGRDLQGKTFRLSDHLGKDVILLDFWSTYCEPCKAEFPHLQTMYEQARAHGLLVVAVAMDGPETAADIPAFVKRMDIGFPVVLDDDSRIASLYNPKKSMPLSVLISKTGRITVVREGYNPGDEKLVQADVTKELDQAAAPH